MEEGFLCLLVDKVIKIIESSSFKLLIELDMKKKSASLTRLEKNENIIPSYEKHEGFVFKSLLT